MALGERALIERFFRDCGAHRADVRVGIGDDAALLDVPAGMELVAKVDSLVSGVHFLPDAPPETIGHRALARSLSDMAAMGARPAWALLALILPRVDERWLGRFASGFDALARQHEVALVGGDTTTGPLSISVQLLGYVRAGRALLRSGARPGDGLFVSGTFGDSAAGLRIERGELAASNPADAAYLRQRFLSPTPRVELGLGLGAFASACIDVSDGLFGDAGKLANASACGVEIEYEALPLSAALVAAVGDERARTLALTGGEDYELCFAVPASRIANLQREMPPDVWSYTRIGTVREAPGAAVTRAGSVMEFSHSGFEHFGH
jgi:thiamine-monophosphate kinase